MKSNSSVLKEIIDRNNIYSAICAYKSYSRSLDHDTKNKIYDTDMFNFESVEEIIKRVQNNIKSIMTTDKKFECNVRLRPKKLTDGQVIYRPVHYAKSQIDLISMVTILNFFVYKFNSNKRDLSDLSKLIPENFYGSIPSSEYVELYIPWKRKYSEFMDKYVEILEKNNFKGSEEYELTLDLKNFFPSVNPKIIIAIIYSFEHFGEYELNDLVEAVSKLIIIKINSKSKSREYYISSGVDEDRVEKFMESGLTKGLPQGLPQSYFFANLVMSKISNITYELFEGQQIFYVDDSYIFTDKKIDNLEDSIIKLNERINTYFNGQIKEIKVVSEFDINDEIDYCIEFHTVGKSNLVKITKKKRVNIQLFLTMKEVSTISYDIVLSKSASVDESLLKKSTELKKMISNLLLKNEYFSQEDIKKLKRYNKFFEYRVMLLESKLSGQRIDVTELIGEFRNVSEYSVNDILNHINETIFEIQLVESYKYATNDQKKIIIDIIKIIENKIYSKSIKTSSKYYSSLICSKYIDNNFSYNLSHYHIRKIYKNENSVYTNEFETRLSMLKLLVGKIQYIINNKSTLNELPNISPNIKLHGAYFDYAFHSSDFIKRSIFNLIISQFLKIDFNNSKSIYKINNLPIHYLEYRFMMFIRSDKTDINHLEKVLLYIINDDDLNLNSKTIDSNIYEAMSHIQYNISNFYYIDNLIKLHFHVASLWANGSLFFYDYTNHNQLHSISLIKNSNLINSVIDSISLNEQEKYVLYSSAYLHDISLVLFPTKTEIQKLNHNIAKRMKKVKRNNYRIKTGLTHQKYTENHKKNYNDFNSKFQYYNEIKSMIRREHHNKSATYLTCASEKFNYFNNDEIKSIAEISKNHGVNIEEINKIRSKLPQKMMIRKLSYLLRFVDNLDITSERVYEQSYYNNLEFFGNLTRFHWLSHLITNQSTIFSEYEYVEKNHKVIERVYIEVHVVSMGSNLIEYEVPGFINVENEMGRTNIIIDNSNNKHKLAEVNETFAWFYTKNHWLFNDLFHFQKYINNNQKTLIKTQFYIRLIQDEIKDISIINELKNNPEYKKIFL